MVQMRCINAGIGAQGSGMARFFYPRAKVRDKWPDHGNQLHLSGIVVTGEGTHHVQMKEQLYFSACIPENDDDIVFHTVKKNF